MQNQNTFSDFAAQCVDTLSDLSILTRRREMGYTPGIDRFPPQGKPNGGGAPFGSPQSVPQAALKEGFTALTTDEKRGSNRIGDTEDTLEGRRVPDTEHRIAAEWL